MRWSRVFAMPNRWTFEMAPVADLLDRWLPAGLEIVDPFAGHSTRAQRWANDLNPESPALYHETAQSFVERLQCEGVKADAVLFDPPYSPRQISECYKSVGMPVTTEDTQNAALYAVVKDGLHAILREDGIAICCGWNSGGFGLTRGYEMLEVLLVNHGAAHNDTICTVERRVPILQGSLL